MEIKQAMENKKTINDETMKKYEDMRNSGLYPIVNLNIFETVADLKIDDYTLEHEQESIEKYKVYLDHVLSMKQSELKNYLTAVKKMEILDTQLLESEDSYIMKLYLEQHKISAIDYLLTSQKYPTTGLTREKIITAHQKNLEGTPSAVYADKEYRTRNTTYVSKSGYGETKVHYFALDYHDIEEGIMNLTLYYNSNLHNQYTLIKPVLVHGLVGALQMFDDGNTRCGRILQNVKAHELTEKNMKIDLPSPALYSSRAYLPYRDQYRQKLGDIAIEPNEETWNSWINFNLNRIEDQTYYMDSKLAEYKKLR